MRSVVCGLAVLGMAALDGRMRHSGRRLQSHIPRSAVEIRFGSAGTAEDPPIAWEDYGGIPDSLVSP